MLKAPDVPSVLLELGFLSNAEDEKQLTDETWRDRMAVSVASAIDGYFSKRIARAPYGPATKPCRTCKVSRPNN